MEMKEESQNEGRVLWIAWQQSFWSVAAVVL
jgi:hypothetical protein